MSKLLDALDEATNSAFTENGAIAFASTRSDLLDFFSMAGGMRDKKDNEIIKLFTKAYSEDANRAMRCLFYLRDIRGGQGERKLFRTITRYLANSDKFKSIEKNLEYIPEMGRWDDLIELLNTRIDKEVVSMVRTQLDIDNQAMQTSKSVSLLGKWMPSSNTSSKETCRTAMDLSRKLMMPISRYREIIVNLRKYIGIVESLMASGNWNAITYSSVPSKAMKLYKKAFSRHDTQRFENFLSAVEDGTSKINSSTLYPYEFVRNVLKGKDNFSTSEMRVLDAQWKALPNYLLEDSSNSLVVADVSGSMYSPDYLPIASSIGLAIYFAEHNTGIFKDNFITFSRIPKLQKIAGTNIIEKINNLRGADWNSNTNLEAVFELILDTARKNKLSESEMPTKIFIISDMEFDSCTTGYDNFSSIEEQYNRYGYTIPTIIFWRVHTNTTQVPVTYNRKGVVLASGHSPSIFKAIVKSKILTPYDYMIEVLDSERYRDIIA